MSQTTDSLASGCANDHHAEGGHVLPLKTYFGIFGALVFLTIVTVAISYMNLGPRALIVAIAVAMVKAGLVIGYFMHLKFESRFYSLVFFGSLIFLSIFFVFTFLDLASRDRVNVEHETFAFRRVKTLQELGDSPAAKALPGAKDPGAVRPEAAPKVDLPAAPSVPAPGGDPGALLPGVAPGAPGTTESPPLDQKAIQELQKQLVEALKKEFEKMKGPVPPTPTLPAPPAPVPAPGHP